jgi:hypothetical protein
MKISMTLEDLERLLQEQIELVIDRFTGNSSSYNSNNTESTLSSLPIDWKSFKELGLSAKFPNDLIVLKKYNAT